MSAFSSDDFQPRCNCRLYTCRICNPDCDKKTNSNPITNYSFIFIESQREALLLCEAVKRKYNLLKDSLEMDNFVCDKDKKQLAEYKRLLSKVDKFYDDFAL